MHIVYPAVISALLFSVGVYGVLARRNTILVLMSVELMLNAVNLNLVAFDVWLRDRLHSGQVLTLFVIVIAAAEVGLGLAIVLALYRNRRTVDLDHLRDLAEPADDPEAAGPMTSADAEQPVPAPDDSRLALVPGGARPTTPAPAERPGTTTQPTGREHQGSGNAEPGSGSADPAGTSAEPAGGRTEPGSGRAGEQSVKRGGRP